MEMFFSKLSSELNCGLINLCCGREEMGDAPLRRLCTGVVVKSEMHYV